MISRVERSEVGHGADVLGEEIEERGQVATVGGERVRRVTPLGRQPVVPCGDGDAEIPGRGEAVERDRLGEQQAVTLPVAHRLASMCY